MGISAGDWVMKYTPTPLERISRTTCSTFSSSILEQLLKSRCASSKKNTIRGLSRSPTSGSSSYSSDSIHRRNVEYITGLCISLSAARMLMTPRPSSSSCSQSAMFSAGSPKNRSPP